MSEPEHTDIGRLLAEAVPPLQVPDDPVGEVAARVHRTRLRAGAAAVGAAAVTAALALGVPLLSPDRRGDGPQPAPPASPLTVSDCPVEWYHPVYEAWEIDEPGPLVATGATGAALCVVGSDPRFLVLRQGIDRLTAALNALPTRDDVLPYWDDLGCIRPLLHNQYWLVLGYPDGGRTRVFLDRYCYLAHVPGGPVRYEIPPDEFLPRYFGDWGAAS